MKIKFPSQSFNEPTSATGTFEFAIPCFLGGTAVMIWESTNKNTGIVIVNVIIFAICLTVAAPICKGIEQYVTRATATAWCKAQGVEQYVTRATATAWCKAQGVEQYVTRATATAWCKAQGVEQYVTRATATAWSRNSRWMPGWQCRVCQVNTMVQYYTMRVSAM
jgi:hypothetical protein